jgi:hypothetical protein
VKTLIKIIGPDDSVNLKSTLNVGTQIDFRIYIDINNKKIKIPQDEISSHNFTEIN